MPIPVGAKQVRGQPNRVQLASGEIVTRASALSMGARNMGYKNHNDYRKHSEGDKKYFNSWIRTEQGQRAFDALRARNPSAKPSDLKQELIAARNAKPSRKRGAGAAYTNFMSNYGLADEKDWIDY